MDKYWRLLTAIFLLLAGIALLLLAFLFQGASVAMGLCFYAGLLCVLLGITKGLFVIIDQHREQKE